MQARAVEPVYWAHGMWDDSGAPVGKLLSDNHGYWGESLLTGVEYSYESTPDNPPDVYKGNNDIFGRRLLDGNFGGSWHVPVGQKDKPLVVVFDFKRPCLFSEVDLYAMRAPHNSFTLEVAETLPIDSWRQIYTKPFNASETNTFYRARLPAQSNGRYLRLSFKGGRTSYLDEVIVWGDGEVSAQFPEQFTSVSAPPPPPGTRDSLPGIPSTRFTESAFAEWRERLGAKSALPLLWAAAPEAQPTKAILPEPGTINAAANLAMARNETESRYFTLTNPGKTNATVRLRVVQPDAKQFKCELLGGGVVPAVRPTRELSAEEQMRLFINGNLPPDAEPEGEMQVLPFFAPGQLSGASAMRRYLANPEAVQHFPIVTLPPGGSMVVMARLTTADTPPGNYRVSLQAVAPNAPLSEMSLDVTVVDLVLPQPDIWLRAWGPGTRQFPFESASRFKNDVAAVRDLGVTVWDGFPEPGAKAEFFGKGGRTYHHMMMRPARLISPGYNARLKAEDLTDDDRRDLTADTGAMVQEAKRLGLAYNQWFIELWDEPGENNALLYGELARIIKAADPKINVYMNPLFWRPGFPPQDEIHDKLKGFYNSVIDISVPIMNLVGDNLTTRELWEHPRLVNAQYLHPARRAGRGISWKSFQHGFNGWGYYCYYAPKGNPWDIQTWSGLGYAYQMVFPVANGVAITPIYETMREGWEDYCLLTALKDKGYDALLKELLTASTQKDPDWQKLRDKALARFRAFSQ